jgi:hypothetical protein
MIPPYDIFQMGGSLVWIEAAATLDGAKARIQELAATSPGEYLIVNQRTGSKLVMKSDRTFEAANN